MNVKRLEPELPLKSKSKCPTTTTRKTTTTTSPQLIPIIEGEKRTKKSLEIKPKSGRGKDVVIKTNISPTESEKSARKASKQPKERKKKKSRTAGMFRVPLLIGTVQRKNRILIVDHSNEFENRLADEVQIIAEPIDDISSRSTTSEKSKELAVDKWYDAKDLDTTEEKAAAKRLRMKIKRKKRDKSPTIRLPSNVVQGNETNADPLFSEIEENIADVELDDHHHIIFLKKLEAAHALKKLKDTPTPPKPEYFGVLEIHGLRAWCRADCFTMQMLMTVLLLLFVGFLAFFMYLSLYSYFKNPFMTIYSARFRSSLDFPNVYICPTNFVNKSKIMKRKSTKNENRNWLNIYTTLQSKVFKNSLLGHTNSLWDVITFIITSINGKESVESYNYNQDYHAKLENVYDYLMTVGFDLNEFFRDCAVGVKRVECSKIIEAKLDRNYGKCFSIDVNKQKESVAAAMGGLRLFIDINSDLAYLMKNHSVAEGIYVFVQQKLNGAETNRMFVRPGTHTQIKIRQKETDFLNYKFVDFGQHCYDYDDTRKANDDETIEIMEGEYDQSLCEMDCVQKVALRKCQCLLIVDSSFINPKILSSHKNLTYCDEEDLRDCLYDHLVDAKWKKEIKSCRENCLIPCVHYHYFTFESFLRLRPKPDATKEEFQKYQTDYILLDISYLGWDKINVKQVKSISFDSFASTVGGQFSLWFGMSLLTVVQAIIMIFMIIRFQVRLQLHKRKVEEEEAAG